MFTSSGRELVLEENVRVGLFFDQVSYFINVFFDNFGSGRDWKLGRRDVDGGHKSVDYSGEGVNCEEADVMRN